MDVIIAIIVIIISRSVSAVTILAHVQVSVALCRLDVKLARGRAAENRDYLS